MSVINKMLKDMEARRASKKTEGSSATEGLQAPRESAPKKAKTRAWLLMLLLIVLLLVVAWLIYDLVWAEKFSNNGFEHRVSIHAVKVAPPKPKIAVLSTLLASSKGGQTTLTLELSKARHYQLLHDADKRQLKIILSNTDSTFPLSELPTVPAIDHITATPLKNNLVLTLQLAPGSSVKSFLQNQENPKIIYLTLSNPDMSAIAAGASTMEKQVVPLTDEQKAQKTYAQALALLSNGNIPKAVTELEQTLTIKPDYLPAQSSLITLLLQQRRTTLAQQYLEQALTQWPQNADLLQLQARLYLFEGKTHRALSVLQAYSPAMVEAPSYYALIAAVQQRLKNYLVAAQLYDQLVRHWPGNGKWWMGLGISLESLNKNNAALEAYHRALATGSLDPNLQAYVATRITQLGGSQ
jgi:tetratricopeptide (TPR) repeat protein